MMARTGPAGRTGRAEQWRNVELKISQNMSFEVYSAARNGRPMDQPVYHINSDLMCDSISVLEADDDDGFEKSRPAKRRALGQAPPRGDESTGTVTSLFLYDSHHSKCAEESKRKPSEILRNSDLRTKRQKREVSARSQSQSNNSGHEAKDSNPESRQIFRKKFPNGCIYDGEWLPLLGAKLVCKEGHDLASIDSSTGTPFTCDHCQERGLRGARVSCKLDRCDYNVCNCCAFRAGKMGIMDGHGIFTWPNGRCFEGIFHAGLPISGKLIESTGDVYSASYSGDKSLIDGAEPISKRLAAIYLPLDLNMDKVVSFPNLLETAPVNAYTSVHSGLADFSLIKNAFRTSTVEIPDVVRPSLSRSHLQSFFLSLEGISNREARILQEQIRKKSSARQRNECMEKAAIASASDTLSQLSLEQVPNHMDLLLEMLCSLVVTDPDGAAAQMTLGVLHRFLLPYQPGSAETVPAIRTEALFFTDSFTERQLDCYTGMVEELILRGSPTTRLTAMDCLLRIATARGGLRHVSRAVTFLQNSGFSLPLSAIESFQGLLGAVESTLDTDVRCSQKQDRLDSLLTAACSKFATSGHGAPVPKVTMRAMKMLVIGLIRLLACRLSQAGIDDCDDQAASNWLRTCPFFGNNLRQSLSRACKVALGKTGSLGPANLDMAAAGRLEWVPSQLMESAPPDLVVARDRASGVVKLSNGARLRPFEQIVITVLVAEIVANVLSTVPWQRDRDSGGIGISTDVYEGESAEVGKNGTDIWLKSSVWSDATAATLMRKCLESVPAAVCLSATEKALADPCDEVLKFFSCMLDSKMAELIDCCSGAGAVVLESHASVGTEKDVAYWRNLGRIVRILLINVSCAMARPESITPRDLSLTLAGGDVAKISVSSAPAGLSRLIDDNPNTYWQSSGSMGDHTIQVEVNEGLVVSSVSIRVDRQDLSYCPERIELSVKKQCQTSWIVICEKTLEPRGNEFCLIADNLDACEEYDAVKVRVVKNLENGNDSRVRGLRVTGRMRSSICRGVVISLGVAEQVLLSSQTALNKLCFMRLDSAGALSEAEAFQLHLEASITALVSAAAALCVSLASNKSSQILKLLRAVWPASMGTVRDPVHTDSVLRAASAGAEVALTGALLSVGSPLAALEVLGLVQDAPGTNDERQRQCDEAVDDRDGEKLVAALLDYGVAEACTMLESECGREPAALKARNAEAGEFPKDAHSFADTSLLACGQDGIQGRGRTLCASFLGHVLSGILGMKFQEESGSARAVWKDWLLLASCRAMVKVLGACLAKSEGGGAGHVSGTFRWPAAVDRVAGQSILPSCLGPLLLGLAQSSWCSLPDDELASLMELGSMLLALANRDAACLALLEGDVVRPKRTLACPQGHTLQTTKCEVACLCTVCEQPIPQGVEAYSCHECKFKLCCSCSFLSGFGCAKLTPSGQCRPSVWIALCASAFFNAALRKLFDFSEATLPAQFCSTVMPKYVHLLSGGFRKKDELGLTKTASGLLQGSDDADETIGRLQWLMDAAKMPRNGTDVLSGSYEAVNSVFLALITHCRLSVPIQREGADLPPLFAHLYHIAAQAVHNQAALKPGEQDAMRHVTERARFLVNSVHPSALCSCRRPPTPSSSQGVHEPSANTSSRLCPCDHFAQQATQEPTGFNSEWNGTCFKSVVDDVIDFVSDTCVFTTHVQTALQTVESLKARLDAATKILKELRGMLRSAPQQLQKCLLASMDLLPQTLKTPALAASAAAHGRLQAEQGMSSAILGVEQWLSVAMPCLDSEDTEAKLCGLAIVSALLCSTVLSPTARPRATASTGQMMPALDAIVVSGAWDRLLSACCAPEEPSRPYRAGAASQDATRPERIAECAVAAGLAIHSASSNVEGAAKALSCDDPTSYWQSEVESSDAPQGRWIAVELSPPGLLEQVTLHCADSLDMGGGYAPRSVVVEAGPSLAALRQVSAVPIPANTDRPFPLLSESRRRQLRPELCRIVKLRVLECGGRNCRVRGLSIHIQRPPELCVRLPALAILSRSAVAAVVVASCAGGTAPYLGTAPDSAPPYPAATPLGAKTTSGDDSETAGCTARPQTACHVLSGVVGMVEQRRDWSLVGLGLGLLPACLLSPPRSHAPPALLSGRLLRALLLALVDASAPAQIMAAVAAELLALMREAGTDFCDAAALEVADAVPGSSRWDGGDEVPAGTTLLQLLVACLCAHSGNADSFLLARQKVTEVLLGMASCSEWQPALSWLRSMAISKLAAGGCYAVPKNGVEHVTCGLASGAPQWSDKWSESRPQAGHKWSESRPQAGYKWSESRPQAETHVAALHLALGLAAGFIPLLMSGCTAQLPCSKLAQVLSYEPGDVEVALVDSDGVVELATSSVLVPVSTSPSLPDEAGLQTALMVLKREWAGTGPAQEDGGIGWCGVLSVEAVTQALRCVAEHAQVDAVAAVVALDAAGLLPRLISMAAAAPSGPMLPTQLYLEECAAACGVAAHRAALGASLPLRAAVAARDSDGPSSVQDLACSGACLVDRRRIWACAAASALHVKSGVGEAMAELLRAAESLRGLYALKAVLWMLPELAGRRDVMGMEGHALVVKAVRAGHPGAHVRRAVRRLMADGEDAGVASLLARVLEDLDKSAAPVQRQSFKARHILEAAPLCYRTGPWSCSMGFPGQADFQAECDRATAPQGTLTLYSQIDGDASVGHVTDDESDTEQGAAADGLMLLSSLSAADDSWAVTVPGPVLHARFDASNTPAAAAMRMVATCSADTATAESEHNYRDSVSYRGAIVLEGAAEVLVEFDPRCSTEAGCDSLTFYSDASYQPDSFSAKHTFSGRTWTNFRVAGPAVHYWFQSDSTRNDWGYRFAVRAAHRPPLTPDADARLEAAAAVIDAALADPRYAALLRTREWTGALARACAAADGARRLMLVGCLTRLLEGVASFDAAEVPDDDIMAPLVEHVMRTYDERAAAGEPVGSDDSLAHALLLSTWCPPPPSPTPALGP